MQNTHNLESLGAALVELMSFLAAPQRDDVLLREARVEIDRALFPLLVQIGRAGALGVADLADRVGRDHTTVSRQLAKLENDGFVVRRAGAEDKRRNAASLTRKGTKIVAAITGARRRLLGKALVDWSAADIAALAALNKRFAESLRAFAG